MQHIATMSAAFRFWTYLVSRTLFCFYHSCSWWDMKRGGENYIKGGQLKGWSLRREERGEEVACLGGKRKDPNVKAAVDKRGRTGRDGERRAHLWKQSWGEAMKSQNSDSAEQDYKLDTGQGGKEKVFPQKWFCSSFWQSVQSALMPNSHFHLVCEKVSDTSSIL